MAYICLRCGNVSEALAEGGRCPICGAVISTAPSVGAKSSPPRGTVQRFSETSHKRDESVGKILEAEVPHPTTENWFSGMFVAAIITYPLGIFLPLATISKHMNATDALDAAERTGTGGVLTSVGRWLLDIFEENPTIVDEANTFSLAGGLKELLAHGQIFLFAVVLAFSVLFPIAKMILLGRVTFADMDTADRERSLKRLATFGKWSMLDVFVIALLVVSLKLGDMVNVQIHCGIYFFAASVLLTMALTQILHRARERVPAGR